MTPEITTPLAERLGDRRLAGFLALELREHGHRVGFEAVGLSGQKATLAHVRSRSPVRVRRNGVEPDRLRGGGAAGTGGAGARAGDRRPPRRRLHRPAGASRCLAEEEESKRPGAAHLRD